jgi:hypothetical protein
MNIAPQYPWVARTKKINDMIHDADESFRLNNRMDLVRNEGWLHHLMELVRNVANVKAQVQTMPMLTVQVGLGIPPLPFYPFSQKQSDFWEDVKRQAGFQTDPNVVFTELQKIEIRDYFRKLVTKKEKNND